MSRARATVRLQLHAAFTLNDAREQVPYYHAMGFSHFYLSPISCAVAGSTHGYDVVDHSRVNPELGGESALLALSESLRERGMGVLLDIVPNHMATHATNKWWWDTLAQGQQSPYAGWFDIDWHPADVSLHGKVLAPFLGQNYDTSLQQGVLRLVHDAKANSYFIQAGESPFPLAKGTFFTEGRSAAAVLADYDPTSIEGRRRLHELLERQHYRLCEWHRAADRINWRRFFEISGLIGVRVEQPQVFDAVHQLPLRLYEQGVVDGLRIDHVDGLARPLSYCASLRQAMRERRPLDTFDGGEPWLVIEKILASHETLDERWQVDGTTGYDFMDQVGGVLHSPSGSRHLVKLWRDLTKNPKSAEAFVREARLTLLRRHFVAERNALLNAVCQAIKRRAGFDDVAQETLGPVLEALLAEFSVYRTYLDEGDAKVSWDEVFIAQAASSALAQLNPDSHEGGLLDLIVTLLMNSDRRDEVVRRFQQLTPPLAAKSIEDTVFYRYGPMLWRNDVGSDPTVPAVSLIDFHTCNFIRSVRFPAGLVATGTHDHKRGEDARARLAVLSQQPAEWAKACQGWSAWKPVAGEFNTPQGRAERYMLWQALVGAWPLSLKIDDVEALAAFARRMVDWQRKALREAKQSSNWFDPNLPYEAGCAQYIYELLGWSPLAANALAFDSGGERTEPPRMGHDPRSGLLRSFHDFVHGIAAAGAINGLAQTTLRLTVPGIPDQYQGAEWWDHSLVDPDNRRAVDHALREHAAASMPPDASLAVQLRSWQSGRLKQALIKRLLALRSRQSAVFALGDYVPLEVIGPRSEHVIAFMRVLGEAAVLVAVPRLCASALKSDEKTGLKMDMTYWDETGIMVPELPGHCMKNVFTGGIHKFQNGGLMVRELFADFPCAVLAT